MKKQRFGFSILLIIISILLSISGIQQRILVTFKYCSMACGIAMLSYTLLKPYVKRKNHFLVIIGYLMLLCYILLTIDTFLIHAISWFPGILRYPVYSLYGWCYLIFLLPGWLLCYHE